MLTVAILAAGKGTRMASTLPKVLHKLSGKTLLQRVINSCNELKPDKIFIIVGHKSKEVEESVLKKKNIHFIVQNPQKGTGHAIQVLSQDVKKHEGNLMVLNGDVPLIKAETLKDLIKYHDSKIADVSLITSRKKNPHVTTIAFSAQMDDRLNFQKLNDKNVDFLVINNITKNLVGSNFNKVSIINKDKLLVSTDELPKNDIAKIIIKTTVDK